MLCKAVCCTVDRLIVWNIPILIPLDLNIILDPYKFSLQAAVDRHGNLFTVAIILLLSIAVENVFIVMMIKLQNAILLIHVIHLLYIHYCINWEWSVPDQTAEGGTPLTPMVPAHLSIPLITGRGTCTKTCGIGRMFPPDDLWMVLILTRTVYWYMINF